jgi:hypothetical protein
MQINFVKNGVVSGMERSGFPETTGKCLHEIVPRQTDFALLT